MCIRRRILIVVSATNIIPTLLGTGNNEVTELDRAGVKWDDDSFCSEIFILV